NINRILWYCYYIPMLFVPLLSIFVSASIGKPENSRMSKWLIPATTLTFIFTLLVLTNDLHQFVFAFPENASVFTDEDYTYQTGYILVIGWEIVCALIAIGTMLINAGFPRPAKSCGCLLFRQA
ncbi:MAG: histidine kinase N-terminal 7TM domain-containing protein, partial [Oscillospiraceae bacterium]